MESRRRARAFVLGLLADLPRKNRWTIAEHAWDGSPGGIQHFLALPAGTPGGHALTGRELYRPKSWTDDPARASLAADPPPHREPAFYRCYAARPVPLGLLESEARHHTRRTFFSNSNKASK